MYVLLMSLMAIAAAGPQWSDWPADANSITDDDAAGMTWQDSGDPAVLWQSAPDAPGYSGDPAMAPPDVWLGIRLVPVPDALAAHVGDGGLMVVNVAVGSPADGAGITRYDILRTFAGQPVDSLKMLHEAMLPLKAGETVAIELVRNGQAQSLDLTVAARPAGDADMQFRFEEPEDTLDQSVTYRGHRLLRDDQGRLVLEPLGQLRFLPDQLFDLGGTLQLPDVPAPDALLHRFGADDSDGTKVFSITESDDNGSISVSRGGDGVYTVTRTDADGNETTATYETLDALRAADEQAAKLAERVVERPLRLEILTKPGERAQLQEQFQQQWQEMLAQQRANWGRQQQMLADQQRKAAEMARKALEDYKRQFPTMQSFAGSAAAPAAAPQTRLKIESDGRITVTIDRDGALQVYEFANRETMQREAPQLYEKFVDVLQP